MKWLSRILKNSNAWELDGIRLGKDEPCWKVSATKDLPLFLRAIKDLVPQDAVLYLEEGCAFTVNPNDPETKELQSYLYARKPRQITKVYPGTITYFSRLVYFHIATTRDNLEGLAELANEFCEVEVAIHLHIYLGEQMLLQWYDAFTDPIYISKTIPETNIKEFSQVLGVSYEEVEHP